MQTIRQLVDDIKTGKTSGDSLNFLDEKEKEAPYASLVYILRAMNEPNPELRFQAAIYSPDRGRLKKLVDTQPVIPEFIPVAKPLPLEVVVPKKEPILDFSQGLDDNQGPVVPEPKTKIRPVAMWKITPLSIIGDQLSQEAEGNDWKLSIPAKHSSAEISTPLNDYVKEQTSLGAQKTEEVFVSLVGEPKQEGIDLVNKFLAKPPRTLRKVLSRGSLGQVIDPRAHESLSSDENLVTETLAKLHLRQNHPGEAIQIYEQLRLRYPEKSRYFEVLIQKIKENEL